MHRELIISIFLLLKLMMDHFQSQNSSPTSSKYSSIVFLVILSLFCLWIFNRLVSTVDRGLLVLLFVSQLVVNINLIRSSSSVTSSYNKSISVNIVSLLIMFKFIYDKYELRKQYCNVV